MTLIAPRWEQKEWFPDLLEFSSDPSFPLPLRRYLLTQYLNRMVHPVLSILIVSCLETLKSFAKSVGYSSRVAKYLANSRRKSSIFSYQCKWTMYGQWCRDKGFSSSSPSVPVIADFLAFLFEVKKFSLPTIKYCQQYLNSNFHPLAPTLL